MGAAVHAYGLRHEALELLARKRCPSRPPMSEPEMRDKQARARELGDDEALALWSRLLWRHFLREPRARRRLVLVEPQ